MEERELAGEISPPAGKKENKWVFFRGVLVGILLGLAFIMGFLGIRSLVLKKSAASVMDETTEEKLGVLNGLIHTYYYQDVDDADLSDGLLKGFVEGLNDPYSAYYNKEEYEQFMISTTGNYAGIGAVLSQDKDTNRVSIIKIYPGSPAEKAGLRVDDVIISADGVMAVDMELSDFVQHIRGEAGTSVSLEIYRDGQQTTYEVEREAITIPSVSYRMLGDDVGYIMISEFSEGTASEFEAALSDLKSQGMRAVIYDVRSNPGGLVDAVTDILDDILPKGTTVYMMDKKGEKTTYTSDEETQEDFPTVVLINGNSASAAEIFSGAIRDFKYGTLVGTKTYGKGVVQNTLPLSDGSALKLTIASYYTPSGECIQGTGIEPDVELEYEYTGEGSGDDYEYDKDNQVQKALEILKK